jgi:hypothetical protein
LLALFCFLGYYWSENPRPVDLSIFRLGAYPIHDINTSGQIFFVAGIIILLLSAGLTFVLHIHLRVYKGYMVIDGFRTSQRIKIPFSEITHVRRSRYKQSILTRAVYNLHNKGIIRFYTSGREFVELGDRSGFTYRIGTAKSRELYNIVRKELMGSREITETI